MNCYLCKAASRESLRRGPCIRAASGNEGEMRIVVTLLICVLVALLGQAKANELGISQAWQAVAGFVTGFVIAQAVRAIYEE